MIGNNGILSANNQLNIGRGVAGIVRVDGVGAQLNTPDTQDLIIGRDSGGKGLLQIDQGSVTAGRSVAVASTGEGILRMNGGSMSVGSTGTLTIGDAGTLEVTGGTLYFGLNGTALTSSGVITLSGGTIGASATTVGGGWSSAANMTLGTTNGDITFQAANANGDARNITLSGQLSGDGGLIKTGGGTLTLGAANNYTGNTTIRGGTLALGASGSLASSEINVQSGIFDVSVVSGGFSLASGQTLSGTGTVNGAVTVATGSTLAPGNSPGTITINGDLIINGTYDFEAQTAAIYDSVIVNGDLTLNDGWILDLSKIGSGMDFGHKLRGDKFRPGPKLPLFPAGLLGPVRVLAE